MEMSDEGECENYVPHFPMTTEQLKDFITTYAFCTLELVRYDIQGRHFRPAKNPSS